MTDTEKLLREARTLLFGEAGAYQFISPWCRVLECHARDAAGNPLEADDPAAVQFTVTGVLARLGTHPLADAGPLAIVREDALYGEAMRYLIAAAIEQSGGYFTPNGVNNLGPAQAARMLDRAIQLAATNPHFRSIKP